MALQFCGSDNKFSSFEKAKVVIVPVPYGETESYRKGTEKGPAAILRASENMELFDEELQKEIHTVGINTIDALKVKGLKPEKIVDLVEEKVSGILKHDKLPVILGGEHSVSIGAVKAIKNKYKDLSVLYFDAHYDLRDSYDGSKYNHACVARRLSEIAPVAEAGMRSLSKEEGDFLPHKNIRTMPMSEIMEKPNWLGTLKDYLSGNVYISIDLDVFDPSIMPSVGTPEPGGVAWYDFLKALSEVIKDKKIVGLDVVELCPIKDMVGPDFMAARLIYKILGYLFR